jgi:hypothetical protein
MLTSVGLYFVKRLTRTVVLFLVGNNVEVIEFPLLYILSYFTPSVKCFGRISSQIIRLNVCVFILIFGITLF